MLVWVDCTAAAHPLVLRPIIERLEAQGHEVFITAREYGQTVGILDRLGMPYTAVGEHGGASKLGKVRALGGRSARLARLVWERRPELAIAHGSVDLAVVSACFRDPLGADAGLRVRAACSARSPSGWRAGCWRRTRSRSSGWRKIGAKGEEAGPLPGPEGGVLPRRLRARPGGPRRARARPREGARRRPAAAGDLRVPRPQRPLRRRRSPPRRGEPRRRRWSSPAPSAQARGGAGARRAPT